MGNLRPNVGTSKDLRHFYQLVGMEYLKHIVYINLDKRKDRCAQFESELKRMGLHGVRFSAIETDPGVLGCCESHLSVLKYARLKGWPQVCIFEDDFEFIVDKSTLHEKLGAFFGGEGRPFDILMLSYNLLAGEPYDTIVGYARNAQSASGYIVHRRFYDTLIENLEYGLTQLRATGEHWNYTNDQVWKRLQSNSEWFYFRVRLGKQRAGYSDLAGHYVDYGV
jgi:hypothetical protein